jgi:pimeloyl-ACP methyl ester carboxylesterase
LASEICALCLCAQSAGRPTRNRLPRRPFLAKPEWSGRSAGNFVEQAPVHRDGGRDLFHGIDGTQEARVDANRVTSKDGTRITFDRSGDGPALILVGGALSDRSGGAPLAKLLAPRFTVFSYDRRGRGDSEDTSPYSVEREIEDLEALIDEAGGTSFVHGHSSGAVLALEAAARLPAKIEKLSLYEPPFIIDDSRPPPPENFLGQIDELIAAGRRGDAVEFWMTEVVRAPAEAVAQMRSAPTWPALEALVHTLAYDVAVLGDNMAGDPLPARQWATATAPTLVMDGGASPAWIRNSARALADVLPNAQHRTLEGQTHAAAPEVLAPEIERFFVG